MKTKKFHLGDVLSIITGKLLSPRHMEGLYDILNFMTGDDLFTHQLGRASGECKPYLLRQFPQLATPEMNSAVAELDKMLKTRSGKGSPEKLVMGWLSKLISGKYGVKCEEMLTVKPIPKDDHDVKDPVEELKELAPHAKIVQINTDEDVEE